MAVAEPRRTPKTTRKLAAEVIPVPRAVGGDFAREIAREEQTTGIGSFSTLYAEDPHPSRILRDKTTAIDPTLRLGELYDRMLETDLDLASFARKRADAVLALPRRIVPAEDTPLARDIALFCRQALAGIRDFNINLEHQLGSLSRGIAFEELVWGRMESGPWAGAIVPVELIDRPMWRFLFKRGELYVRQALGKEPLAAPAGKFLVMRHGSKDSAWGKALLDEMYWAWWLKKNGLKFYAVFLDKFGQPTLVGKYRSKRTGPGGIGSEDTETQKNQRLVLEAIETIQTNYGVAVPDGVTLEFLEAARGGSATYEQFIGILTRSMALAYLGEVDTSGAAKGPGSFAKSEVSNEVRKEKVELDAHAVGAHLKDNLFRPMVELNFGPGAPVPSYVIDTVETADREQRMKGIEATLSAGEKVSRRYFYQTMQVPEPQPGEETIERKPAPPPVAPPAPGAPPAEEIPDETPDDEPKPDAKATSRGHQVELAAAEETSPPVVDPDLEEELDRALERSNEIVAMAETLAKKRVDYYAGWRRELLAAWDDGDIAAGRGLRRLVGALDPLASATDLQTGIVHGLGLGLRALAEDMGTGALRLSLPPGWQQVQTPQSAEDYWAQLLGVPKEVFAAFGDSGKRMAFAVAGVEDMALLVDIQRLIGRAVAEGMVRDEFVRELDRLFEAKGVSPLARWHAELVYQYNVRNAAALMLYRQTVGNPAAKRLTPYLVWWSLDDGRVRPKHVAMHGHIAAVDHEIWKTWWPPAGHGCRCYVSTINLAKARRMGLTGSEPRGPWQLFEGAPVLPDDGFRGAPPLDTQAEEMEMRAIDIAGEAKAEGSSDLDDALELLFKLFFGLISDVFGFAQLVQPTRLASGK